MYFQIDYFFIFLGIQTDIRFRSDLQTIRLYNYIYHYSEIYYEIIRNFT